MELYRSCCYAINVSDLGCSHNGFHDCSVAKLSKSLSVVLFHGGATLVVYEGIPKDIELFFLIYCCTYNLIRLVSFKVLPSTVDIPLPAFFSSSGTRPGTCFTGWREGLVANFLLSPLPSEIGELLGWTSTLGTGKSPQKFFISIRTI